MQDKVQNKGDMGCCVASQLGTTISEPFSKFEKPKSDIPEVAISKVDFSNVTLQEILKNFLPLTVLS